jgi:hypothetical protein
VPTTLRKTMVSIGEYAAWIARGLRIVRMVVVERKSRRNCGPLVVSFWGSAHFVLIE